MWRGAEFRSPEVDDEASALSWLEWCVASHLLGDLTPLPTSLHAAAVEMPGAGAILVPAHAGGGKSTLALALVQQGMTFLGDEYVPLVCSTPGGHGPLSILAYPRALGLKEPSPLLSEVPGQGRAIAGDETTERWLLPENRRAPGTRVAPVRAVVFAGYRPGDVRLTTIAQADGLSRLLALVPMIGDHPAEAFATLTALVENAELFELKHGDAAAAAAAVLASFG